MKKVYKQINTGDLYVIQHGAFGSQVSLTGETMFTLAPPVQLVGAITGLPRQDTEKPLCYSVLNTHHALSLVVTRAELASDFVVDDTYVAAGNLPITEILAQYKDECCDFSNKEWLVTAALRATSTMPDSQVRCLLYSLAKVVQPTCALAKAD